MIIRERAIVNHLVNFRWVASVNTLYVGGFGQGEGHVIYDLEELWLDLDRSLDVPAAHTIFKSRAFSFTGGNIAKGAAVSWVTDQRI